MTEQTPLRVAAHDYPTDDLVECPYAAYRELRDEAPVYRLANGDYAVTRWEDIVYVSSHPELFSSRILDANPGWAEATGYHGPASAEPDDDPWPVSFSDPPAHWGKRALLLPMVSRRRLTKFEPVIRGLADDLIDGFIDRGEADFKAQFAEPFPPTVFLHILGTPPEDAEQIHAWMSTFLGAGFRYATDEQKQRQQTAMREARAYFEDQILQRQANPLDDFLSEAVHAKLKRDGDLELDYLIGEITNLYLAAYANTLYMLANTLLLLLEHPDELARLRANPSLIPRMIDEALRIETPMQWGLRLVTQDTELRGVHLPKGASVLTFVGAANRDERTFDDPARFWIDRPRVIKDHLAFGRGIHRCVGAPLARLEGRVAFEQLLSRLSDIRLAPGKNDFKHATKSANHRVVKALHIEFDRPVDAGKPSNREVLQG
jgi:cytochrome P450